jgi:DNA-binding NtrC family response regulator
VKDEMPKNKRILIVDDEQALLIALKKLLQDNKVQVDTAETMQEAMSHINESNYEVVIADIRLSGILNQEGLEILRYVKENKPGTRVMLMTGYGSQDIMEHAFDLGADYYFEKPVSIRVLKDALKNIEMS